MVSQRDIDDVVNVHLQKWHVNTEKEARKDKDMKYMLDFIYKDMTSEMVDWILNRGYRFNMVQSYVYGERINMWLCITKNRNSSLYRYIPLMRPYKCKYEVFVKCIF